MSVRAPSFEQLVDRADAVVQSVVVDRHCVWKGAGADRHIATLVTLKVEKVIAGSAPAKLELEILGGSLDGESLLVEGLTQFEVGDRDVLFVRGNGRLICPLVAMNYGRYLVVNDSSKEAVAYVMRCDGSPLRTVDDVAKPLSERLAAHTAAAPMAGAMTLAQFEDAIVRQVSRHAPTKPEQPK